MSPRKKAEPTPLGNHIIRKRKQRGWTRADLARETKLPYGTVRNVEQGYSKKPDEQIIRAIIAVLDDIDEGVAFALAGYGDIPKRDPAQIVVELDELGEVAPLWRDVIEKVKRSSPERQNQALEVLTAQLNAASRRW